MNAGQLKAVIELVRYHEDVLAPLSSRRRKSNCSAYFLSGNKAAAAADTQPAAAAEAEDGTLQHLFI